MFQYLSALLVGGACLAAGVRWLRSRRSTLARAAGGLLGGAPAAYCAWIVFILVADNGFDLRAKDLLVILDFAVVGAILLWAATRSRWKPSY